VDVTRIVGLDEIREEDGTIVIGAGVTHNQIVESRLLQQKATALVEASYVVGGPQVRNVATIGGNVAHALPAADGTTALNALDAEVEVASYSGRRWIPFIALFLGPGKSAIDSTHEVLTALRFRATGAHEASAFSRIMYGGTDHELRGKVRVIDDRIEEIALAVAPVAPTPYRCQQTEALLTGKPATSESIEAAVSTLLGECKLRTSPHRATAEYRKEVLPVLLRRTLSQAIERAKTGEVVPEIYRVE
jgi:carbon-monoxide dehydrogenase medium subunit